MNYNLTFSLALCACFISWTTAVPTNLKSGNKNKTAKEGDGDPLGDDRINLNWGSANAHAVDDQGRYSGVQSNSWGVTSGIKNIYTGQHMSLGSKAGSTSNTYSSGYGSPQTWANTNSHATHDSATGSAIAGFSGGRGSSQSESHSQTQTYDLGGGNVLYSNLKDKSKGNKEKTSQNSTETEDQLKLKESEEIKEEIQDDKKTETDKVQPEMPILPLQENNPPPPAHNCLTKETNPKAFAAAAALQKNNAPPPARNCLHKENNPKPADLKEKRPVLEFDSVLE